MPESNATSSKRIKELEGRHRSLLSSSKKNKHDALYSAIQALSEEIEQIFFEANLLLTDLNELRELASLKGGEE